MMRMCVVDFKGLIINVAGCGGFFLFSKNARVYFEITSRQRD